MNKWKEHTRVRAPTATLFAYRCMHDISLICTIMCSHIQCDAYHRIADHAASRWYYKLPYPGVDTCAILIKICKGVHETLQAAVKKVPIILPFAFRCTLCRKTGFKICFAIFHHKSLEPWLVKQEILILGVGGLYTWHCWCCHEVQGGNSKYGD